MSSFLFMRGWAGRQVVFGQIGRRQPGGGVLLDELLEQRRHGPGVVGGPVGAPGGAALAARWPSALWFLSCG